MHWKFRVAFALLCSVLCAGQEKKIDAHEPDVAAISGTVARADTHLPLKNVQLTIMGRAVGASASADAEELESGQVYQSSANTDDKGHFEIANLPPGIYYVRAAHAGMVLKGAHLGEGMLVNLQAGQSQNLSLLMLPGCAITGRVLNEEGEPMQKVSVTAMRYVYTIAGRHLTQASSATSDDKDEYRLFGLKPGSYVLMADTARGSFEDGSLNIAIGTRAGAASAKENQKVYAATYYQNESSPEQATPIVLKPGDEAQANFAFVRVTAHHISGKVSGYAMPKPADKPEEHRRFVTVVRAGSPIPAGWAVADAKDHSRSAGAFQTAWSPPGRVHCVRTGRCSGATVHGGFFS